MNFKESFCREKAKQKYWYGFKVFINEAKVSDYSTESQKNVQMFILLFWLYLFIYKTDEVSKIHK